MIYVIDASVAAKWFLQEDLHDEARRFLVDHSEHLRAPDDIIAEVANLAWKRVRLGDIEPDQAHFIAAAIGQAIPVRLPSADLVEQAIAIALEIDHPVYDCLYIACAVATGGVLVTADKRLFNKSQGTRYASLIHYLAIPLPKAVILPPLTISLDKVQQAIRWASIFARTKESVDTALHGPPNREIFTFRPAFPSGATWPSVGRQRLVEHLESLSDEERAELLALMWLGRNHRGDRERSWDELVTHARGLDLRYTVSLADHLGAGLAYFQEVIARKWDDG